MNAKLKYHYSILVILSATVFMFTSCKKETPAPVFYGYDYFPTNVGHYVIYNIDSNVYNAFTGKWNYYTYQVKEVIDSVFTDNTGRPTIRIDRYKRTSASEPFGSIQKIWSGNLCAIAALRDEDNYIYMKLIFPVSTGASWNGNSYNTIGEWDYQYTTVNTPLTVGETYFDSTLTVLQRNYVNPLQRQYYVEKYATGVGLIYKYIADSAQAVAGDTLVNGVVYSETYLSSGNQ
jgi:hypothetical protein